MFGEEDIVKSHKRRIDIIANIIVFSFLLILARLWFLQIYKGKELYRYSLENRLRKEVVKAPRGMIFSRDNILLIHNVPRFDAVITPQYLKNKEESINRLSKMLEMAPDEIKNILKKNSNQERYIPVLIKKNISQEEVALIETERTHMPGVSVRTFISREYEDKEIGSHLFGYISEISQAQLPKYRKRDNIDYKLGDFIGQAGIEEMYDTQLRGKDGYEFMEVDARGRMKRYVGEKDLFQGIINRYPTPGKNIRLTIDRDLQKVAYDALADKVGGAVAVNVHTGEVLAMVSRPSFDPAQFTRGIQKEYWQSLVFDTRNPLRDRTIQEHYPPGSTFKLLVAIAALEEKIVDENSDVTCGGTFKVGRRVFHCWKEHGHGHITLHKAIQQSCDIYFYKIATKLDIDVLARYANYFGFGKKSGFLLSSETSGLIPTKAWKKKRDGGEWQLGDTVSCAIGQSYILATPLQLALAYAAMSNGGKLYRPYVVKEIFSNSGNVIQSFSPELVREIPVDQKTLKQINEGLYLVVNSPQGTAWWQRGKGIEMAGKTGTSQVARFAADKIYSKCEDNEYKYRHHGLFVGYAPASNPQIAVAAIVEHGCHGGSAAGPVVREVITKYMEKYMPDFVNDRAKKEKEDAIKAWKEAANSDQNKKVISSNVKTIESAGSSESNDE